MGKQTIIASHPDDPNLYVLSADVPEHGNKDLKYGCVLDLNSKTLYPPLPLVSLGARDPWQKYDGDQNKLEELLKGVKIIPAS